MQRHIDPSAVATAGTRVGSPVLEAYQEHSAIPAGSPPLCQRDDPLASGRGRSRKWPNLVNKADAGVFTHGINLCGEINNFIFILHCIILHGLLHG